VIICGRCDWAVTDGWGPGLRSDVCYEAMLEVKHEANRSNLTP